MSLASKYTPEQIEAMLARYEFLRDNCEMYRIAFEHGGAEEYYTYCDRKEFARSVDSAIKFLNETENECS